VNGRNRHNQPTNECSSTQINKKKQQTNNLLAKYYQKKYKKQN